MEDAITSSSAIKILIDHHMKPDQFTDYILSDVQASSTAELVSDFIGMLDQRELISMQVAECIYTGILTDTGSFSYGSTSAKAHKVAGEMIHCGADNLKIQGKIFQDNSLNQVRLLGYSLYENMTVLEEFNTGYFALSKEELSRFDFQPGDTEGLVNYAISVKNVGLAILMLDSRGALLVDELEDALQLQLAWVIGHPD